MTPKQREYVRHRAAGLGQARAAIAAGYAASSAKVIASRMEQQPAIRAAIDEARTDPAADAGTPEYESAEDYLSAVVRGTAVPDPVRVGAARALLPFERARQRAPMKSATPKQMNASNALAEEEALLDAWAEKAAAVRARLKRNA